MTTPGSRPRRRLKAWTQEECEKLVRLWTRGVSLRAIASALRRTEAAVQQKSTHLRKDGVHLPFMCGEKGASLDLRALNRIVRAETKKRKGANA